MYDLKFYSEYFFRAQPETEIVNELKASIIKDRQQLLNESASAVKGLVRSTERIASPEHSVGAQMEKDVNLNTTD